MPGAPGDARRGRATPPAPRHYDGARVPPDPSAGRCRCDSRCSGPWRSPTTTGRACRSPGGCAGQPCSQAELAAAIWGDDPPQRPDLSLRTCVYGLRRLLPDPARLRTHPCGYLIDVAPGELDLAEFRDLASLGRQALDDGDPAGAADALGRALSLWREPALADLPDHAARERLIGHRRDALEALIDARLALGLHRQVLPELRGIVAAEPPREHAWAQLMLALYRCGARAEALAAFGRLRMTLVRAYGIEPGPE